MQKKIFYFEACDFESYPLGGTLSFSKQFIKNIKEEIFLIGLGEQGDKVGDWQDKSINGRTFRFFPIGIVSDVKKTFLPKRLYTYLLLRKHIEKLNQEKMDLVFTQTPQFIFLISKYNWNKVSFCFAGLGNSVGLSRFKLLRVFGGVYERKLFRHIKKSCDLILAAADQEEINRKSLKYNLLEKKIISFPTRFDSEIFYTKNTVVAKEELGYSEHEKIIVTTGRLSYIKGWKDMIDSFRIAKTQESTLKLIFVGDGEDKNKIINYAAEEISKKEIILFGRRSQEEICTILNAADLFIMFSFVEGWPTSMVEALACGKNIVSSKIGGSMEMISNKENGIIVHERDCNKFAEAIIEVLNYDNPNPKSLEIAKKYSAYNLDYDLKKLLINI
ncbi:glycosyltransferase family 4 protein [Flavobacteriaceae bacterium S0862]|nr:glycosyltransferase family 4 protein [Flavobacteriaceae bacterium S0862]